MPSASAAPSLCPAAHPLVAAFAVTAVAQGAGLVAHVFGRDAAGHPLFSSPLNTLMIALPLYTSWLALLAAGWFAAWKLLPPLRAAVSVAGVLFCAALLLLVPVDFGMQRFRGERLALSHFKTYSPGGLLNSDVMGPVLDDPLYPAITLGIGVAGWLALAWCVRAARRREARTPTWRAVGICAAAAAVCYAPLTFAYYHQRDMAQPPYWLLARALIYPTEPMTPEKESRLRAELRRTLDPAGSAHWLDETHPLLRAAVPRDADRAAPDDPPDIVFFVVESLRGRDVGWGLFPRAAGASVTPQLDALAARSVTFPRYIANGDPSPRGFIAIHSGLWEHRWGFIIANFPNLASDAIPARLRDRGYHTMALWGGNPSFDNQLVWARRWYDELDFEAPGNSVFFFHTRPDRVVIDHFLERIAEHDRRAPDQPFFAYVATNGTHTPYLPETGEPPPATMQARYDLCLKNLDAQLGRAITALQSRPRGRNTIIVVIGDHSDKTDDVIADRFRGLPTDALVWTAVLIHGPERFVGAPRREEFPASHVDLLPTVLAWVGDDRPFGGAGQDLFAPIPVEWRWAFAVNSRGYRLDRAGWTLLVDSADPKNFAAYPWFPRDAPAPVPLAQTPFAADEPARIAERMVYWSYLIEQNRVWQAVGEGKP